MAFMLMKAFSQSQPGRFYTLLGIRDLCVIASREVLIGCAELASRARRVQTRARGVPGWVLDVLAVQDGKATAQQGARWPSARLPGKPEFRGLAVWPARGQGTADGVSPLL